MPLVASPPNAILKAPPPLDDMHPELLKAAQEPSTRKKRKPDGKNYLTININGLGGDGGKGVKLGGRGGGGGGGSGGGGGAGGKSKINLHKQIVLINLQYMIAAHSAMFEFSLSAYKLQMLLASKISSHISSNFCPDHQDGRWIIKALNANQYKKLWAISSLAPMYT